MGQPGFRQFLQPRQLSEEQLDQQVASVEKFEAFLNTAQPPVTLAQADAPITQAFVDTRIADRTNTFDNLVAVARYARFAKNNAAFVAILELLNCWTAVKLWKGCTAKSARWWASKSATRFSMPSPCRRWGSRTRTKPGSCKP
jgi:hypothetical protein